jgi:VIT1/CCC1 family predicted Fe2+/Mn2+ transporter
MSWSLESEQHRHPYPFLGDVILGLNDGIVTTLVFALGVSGAAGSNHAVVIAGLAEMLAGGVSMFLGGFLAGQSEKEAVEHQISVERHEIESEPEEEREELRQIYREKGFTEGQTASIVEHLTSDAERWLNSMVRDELMIRPGDFVSPLRRGAALGLSFAAGALVPIASFLLHVGDAPIASVVLSLLILFGTGAARSRFSHSSWMRSGGQLVLIGMIGTLAGLAIGRLLSSGI